MSAAVTTVGLTKAFGSLRAVDDVSIEVAPGEVFGFLGPNGAGKSTTIRLILGELNPTAGSASILGIPAGDPASRRSVGYIPGDPALDPKLTGREHLDLFAEIRRRNGGGPSPRLDELCERFQLDPTRKLGTLSKGNRQKVAVVQAFMSSPRVLILDEPTSGLDPIQQSRFQELVREVTAAGAAVLLSTHVLSEVERVADRIGIIRRGRLAAVDTVDGLRASARQRLRLHLEAEPQSLALDHVAGVVSWFVTGATVDVTVEGPAQPIFDALHGHHILRVSSDDEDLEAIFLHLYEDEA